jgi:tetratricopeptide (TPR) repeat protein
MYSNITETRNYGLKMFIFDSFHDRNPQAVVDYAKRLKDEDLSPNLKRIVADALISTNDPENLLRAFALDSSRQLEIIEKLIALERYDDIAALSSNNPLAQLYQLFYAKDYDKAISLANNNIELRNDAQARIILAEVYVAQNDYVKAAEVLHDIGDMDRLLSVYKAHREFVSNNEKDAAYRQQLLKKLDETIKLIEDVKRGETKPPQEPPPQEPPQEPQE